jgi:hypothetical protein
VASLASLLLDDLGIIIFVELVAVEIIHEFEHPLEVPLAYCAGTIVLPDKVLRRADRIDKTAGEGDLGVEPKLLFNVGLLLVL